MPSWNGPLHIGTNEPFRVERDSDGSGVFFQGCCQCRLIHEVRFTPAANALMFEFRRPDPEIAKDIEGARLKAEDDQIQFLLAELELLRVKAGCLESAEEEVDALKQSLLAFAEQLEQRAVRLQRVHVLMSRELESIARAMREAAK